MANTSSSPDELEFMIKLYEGGRFSGLLADGSIKAGDELDAHRPLRRLHAARELAAPAAVHRRRRGHGADPVAAALDGRGRLRARGDVLLRRAAPSATCSTSTPWRSSPLPASSPALSEDSNGWAGETGLITDVVERLEDDVAEVDAYLCGPPPMVDAAIALLEAKGVPEAHIYFDKFTTTADD